MSSTANLPRPPQVTLIGWLIVVGSVFVVVSAFEAFTGVRSLDTREMIQEYLDGPGKQLGWSVEQGVQLLQVSSLVTAGCAAMAAVLGWFALRRDRGARIGLTVLALPLFVSGVFIGGFVSSMVAAAAVLLWMQPARDWFNGLPMATRTNDRAAAFDGRGTPQGPAHGQHAPGHQDQPQGGAGPEGAAPVRPGEVGAAGRPVQGFGDQPTWGRAQGPTGGQVAQAPTGAPHAPPHGAAPHDPAGPGAPQAQPPLPFGGVPAPERRPGAVLGAVVITLVFGGFALLSSLASLAVAIAAPDVLFDEFVRQQPDLLEQGVTKETVNATMLFTSSVMSLFSLCAVIAALLVLARRSGGLPVLLVTASSSAAFCLLGTLLVPVLLLPGLASAAVVVLLMRPESRAWLKGH